MHRRHCCGQWTAHYAPLGTGISNCSMDSSAKVSVPSLIQHSLVMKDWRWLSAPKGTKTLKARASTRVLGATEGVQTSGR